MGGNGSGGEGDVADGAKCAHHAVANIGEEGRKAIDTLLKGKMNITDEQAESDAAKVKALHTSVGWFSSPACSLIYQVHTLLYSTQLYSMVLYSMVLYYMVLYSTLLYCTLLYCTLPY